MGKSLKTSGKSKLYILIILISLLVFSSGCVLPPANNSDNHNNPRFTAISAVSGSGLALRSDGRILCWGINRDGFCEIPRNLTNVKSIFRTNFAIKNDGTVATWGGPRLTPVVPSNLTHVVQIARISDYCLALRDDGRIIAWQTSDPPSDAKWTSDEQIARIRNLSDLVSISRNYGLKKDGTVVTWLDMKNSSSPVVPGLSNIVAISDWGDLVALRNDGTVAARKIVRSEIPGEYKFVPVQGIENLSDIRAVSIGFDHILFLNRDGTVISWVKGSVRSTGLNDIQAIFAGDDFDLALKKDGSIIAWGDNTLGQLFTPGTLDNVRSISSGDSSNIILRKDGTIATWGMASQQLCCYYGHEPEGIRNITGILVSGFEYLILENNETIYGWGDRDFGRHPVKWIPHPYLTLFSGGNALFALNKNGNLVLLSYDATSFNISQRLDNVSEISSMYGIKTVALKRDDTVSTWGFDQDWDPVPAHLSDVAAVSQGLVYTLALKRDGTVVGWGDNRSGILDVPEGLSDVTAVSAGGGHNLALKRDGTVVAWGNNNKGACNVPENLHDVVAISAGQDQSFALRKDGSVVAWGETVIPDWNG